jgi:hypothetical protein
MSCCGGGLSAVQTQERGRALVDAGAARGALVKLVYTGNEQRSRAYVAEGKPYFFGTSRRVNAVPARVVPQFLDVQGRYYGSFERFDPALHSEDGAPLIASAAVMPIGAGEGAATPTAPVESEPTQPPASEAQAAPMSPARKRGGYGGG